MMTLPRDIPFPEGAEAEGTLFGHRFALQRGAETLELQLDEASWLLGVPPAARRLRFGVSLGPLPFLVFTRPTLVLAAGGSLDRTFRLPLHLVVAALGDEALPLREIRPPGITRSLYGPVDFGWVCWTVRSLDPDVARLELGQTTVPLSAAVDVTIENDTTVPQEVTKVLIPMELIGLYAQGSQITASTVTMRLVSEQTAELVFEAPKRSRPLTTVTGVSIQPVRRTFALSHTYRTKTGIDYGF